MSIGTSQRPSLTRKLGASWEPALPSAHETHWDDNISLDLRPKLRALGHAHHKAPLLRTASTKTDIRHIVRRRLFTTTASEASANASVRIVARGQSQGTSALVCVEWRSLGQQGSSRGQGCRPAGPAGTAAFVPDHGSKPCSSLVGHHK